MYKTSCLGNYKTTQRITGFTLIELMLVIAVLGVLMMLAIPSFQDTIKKNRVIGHIRDLNSDLNFARGEAASKGQAIAICGANTAMTNCSLTGDWSVGWIVFTETFTPDNGNIRVNNKAADPLRNDEIIRTYKYEGTNTVTVTESDGSTALTGLIYSPQGYTRGSQAGLLKICPSSNEPRYARGVVISPSGRALTTQDTDGDGIHDHTTDDGLGSGSSVVTAALTCP